jgi:hypothetical protein
MLVTRGAGDRQFLGQQTIGMQAIERGQQHALREIAGRAEQEQLGYGITVHESS